MTFLVGARSGAGGDRIARRALLPLTVATVSLSAFLLFVVQPLFAKMVLPRLGGASGVWSVAMVFFQGALLAGYGFADLVARRLSIRQAVFAQIGVMLAACVCLPISLSTLLDTPPSEGAPVWILALFAVSIGPPFFALAAIGPLLQAWFARTSDGEAGDPYFLYAASNVGSFAALLSYPLTIEPLLRLSTQSQLWTAAYLVLILLVAASGIVVLKLRRIEPASKAAVAAVSTSVVPLARRLTWIALAFVPSALLVAVTAQITSDVAAVPFLWVLPLALFLLTFVVTFARRPPIPHRAVLSAQPVVIGALVVAGFVGLGLGILVQIALHLAALFVTAMVCHGELVRRRPQAEHLTGFYLYMSLGGMLGGLFAGLVAPAVFDGVTEYPILLVVALALPVLIVRRDRVGIAKDLAMGAALGGVAVLVTTAGSAVTDRSVHVALAVLSVLLAAVIAWRGAALRVAALAAVLLSFHTDNADLAHISSSERSFFGVHRVGTTPDGRFRVLFHGTTLHGAEERRRADGDGRPPTAVSYFHPGGAYDRAVESLRAAGNTRRVAVTGLGAGVLACYRRAGESWTFFEIDPLVVEIARRDFTYLRSCAPDARIVLGDARLTLASEPAQSFDLIVKDAFTSDSVPVHLITVEALRLYLSRVSQRGAILVHISNRYVEMQSVLARAAAELGLVLYVSGPVGERFDPVRFHARADIAVLARAPEHLGPLVDDDRWTRVLPDPDVAAWTDDYSDVLGALWRRVARGR